eukprot:6198927-Pleurochrysis_carterae.AAC.2
MPEDAEALGELSRRPRKIDQIGIREHMCGTAGVDGCGPGREQGVHARVACEATLDHKELLRMSGSCELRDCPSHHELHLLLSTRGGRPIMHAIGNPSSAAVAA